jgi:hypothetical protein
MKTALLWNTCVKDLEWFKISARSYTKFARGFDEAKCIVPQHEHEAFRQPCHEAGIELFPMEEWPGRGFTWHMLQHCFADERFPHADLIFHIDADCVFGMPCTPQDWIIAGKPLLPYTPYASFLRSPVLQDEMQTFMGFSGKRIDFERGQYNWKFGVDYALGCDAQRECMAWMPIIHIPEVYLKTREIIDARFPDQGFVNYVYNSRNEHPQTFPEFNVLGAVAHLHFEDCYHWHNVDHGGHLFYGKVIQSWSHGGLDREHDYGPQVPSADINSPRKLFTHLGLL